MVYFFQASNKQIQENQLITLSFQKIHILTHIFQMVTWPNVKFQSEFLL